jgi:hypothetical protein
MLHLIAVLPSELQHSPSRKDTKIRLFENIPFPSRLEEQLKLVSILLSHVNLQHQQQLIYELLELAQLSVCDVCEQ